MAYCDFNLVVLRGGLGGSVLPPRGGPLPSQWVISSSWEYRFSVELLTPS